MTHPRRGGIEVVGVRPSGDTGRVRLLRYSSTAWATIPPRRYTDRQRRRRRQSQSTTGGCFSYITLGARKSQHRVAEHVP